MVAIRILLLNLGVLLGFRALFAMWFYDPTTESTDILNALWLGLRYDLRLAATITILFMIVSILRKKLGRQNYLRLSVLFSLLVGFFLFSMYFIDFGHYAYLKVRSSYVIMRFLDNWDISSKMMFESYPVIWLSLGVLLLTLAYGWLFGYRMQQRPLFKGGIQFLGLFVLIAACIYGNFGRYPLRWSMAYTNSSYATALGLNPIMFFFETANKSSAEGKAPSPAKVQKAKRLLASLRGPSTPCQDDQCRITYKHKGQAPNVVVIVMESLAHHKTSFVAKQLDPTPTLSQLAQSSLYYDNYFVPAEGTARSMYGLVTSAADVTPSRTSASRDPRLAKRDIPLTHLKSHQKYYFLGGSANWAQIRALFSGNMNDIHIFEEGSYPDVPIVDVWGISDKDLLLEAAKHLQAEKDPFFAVVQLSGFHRPYTIPENTGGFEVTHPDKSLLKKAGFISTEEYNSIRLSDWSVGQFFKTIKNTKLYDNTIFAIIGDHGLPCEGSRLISKAANATELCKFQTPLIIHAKQWSQQPQKISWLASELDLIPSLIHQASPDIKIDPQTDIFSSQHKENKAQLFYYHYSEEHGAITKNTVCRSTKAGKTVAFNRDTDQPASDEEVKQCSAVAEALEVYRRDQLYNPKTLEMASNKGGAQ